jgi:hypothetical protein
MVTAARIAVEGRTHSKQIDQARHPRERRYR